MRTILTHGEYSITLVMELSTTFVNFDQTELGCRLRKVGLGLIRGLPEKLEMWLFWKVRISAVLPYELDNCVEKHAFNCRLSVR